MNGLPYYKAYPRDFIEGTIGMPFELKAAYRLVLDLIYMQGGSLPDDARYIAGLMGCSVKKWNSIREELVSMGKIEPRNGVLGNLRADKELEILGKFQEKQRENRSNPNKTKAIQTPDADHTEPDTEERGKPLSSAQVVEEIFRIIPKAKARMAPKKTLPKVVKTIIAKTPPESLLAAVRACYTHPDNAREDGQFAPAIYKFLNTGMWENWVPGSDAAAAPAEIADDQWRRLLMTWHDSMAWPAYAGPQPGHEGCRIPEPILDRYRAWVTEQSKLGAAA